MVSWKCPKAAPFTQPAGMLHHHEGEIFCLPACTYSKEPGDGDAERGCVIFPPETQKPSRLKKKKKRRKTTERVCTIWRQEKDRELTGAQQSWGYCEMLRELTLDLLNTPLVCYTTWLSLIVRLRNAVVMILPRPESQHQGNCQYSWLNATISVATDAKYYAHVSSWRSSAWLWLRELVKCTFSTPKTNCQRLRREKHATQPNNKRQSSQKW